MPLEAGTAYIDVLPLLKDFSSELRRQATPQISKASRALQAAAGPLRTAGKNLTRYVTLPVIGLGVVATKTAIDFGSAMAKVAANSNLTSTEVAGFRKEILSLAGETAQAPIELANGLYFLASAGLRAGQISQVLEASAKASAAGMGAAGDVAKITANALNAYAGTGLKATQVTDALAAAVKAGSAEPDEFAGALGRVLPIASKARVSFQQVTASLAAMSNIGLDVNEGTTALRGLLQSIEAPGTQAAKTLKEIGLSADQVRTAIAKDGLAGALDLLNAASHGNIDTLKKIVPNVRALTGLFALSGNRAKAYADALDQVTHSQGANNRAFEITKKQDPAFQWEHLKAELQVTAITLGKDLLPLFERLVHDVEGGVKWFTSLSDATQGNIVKFALMAAALGPLLRLMASGVSIAANLTKAFGASAAAGAAATGASGASGAAAGLGGPWVLFGAVVAGVVGTVIVNELKLRASMDKARHTVAVYGETSSEAAGSLRVLGGAQVSLNHHMADAGVLTDKGRAAIEKQTEANKRWFYSLNKNVQGLSTYRAVMEHANGVSEAQAEHIAVLINGYRQMGGKLDETQQKQIANLLAYGDVTGALKILHKAIGDLPANKKTHIEAPGLAEVLRQVRELNALYASLGSTARFTPPGNQPGGPAGHGGGGHANPTQQARVRLVVGDREMDAYMEEIADGRIADERAFRAGVSRMGAE